MAVNRGEPKSTLQKPQTSGIQADSKETEQEFVLLMLMQAPTCNQSSSAWLCMKHRGQSLLQETDLRNDDVPATRHHVYFSQEAHSTIG
eukprot:1543573-Amphidinium_carterae.1